MALTSSLAALFVLLVVLAVIFYILDKMTIDPKMRNIIYLVIMLLVVALFFSYLGFF